MKIVGLIELDEDELRILAIARENKFGPFIKSRRFVAYKLGIAARTLASYEAGDRRPTIETFIKWSKLVGVSHGIPDSILVGYDAGSHETRKMGTEGDGVAVPHAAAGTSQAGDSRLYGRPPGNI